MENPYKESMRRLVSYVGLPNYGTPRAVTPPPTTGTAALYFQSPNTPEWKAHIASLSVEECYRASVKRRLSRCIWSAVLNDLCLWCWFSRSMCICAQLEKHRKKILLEQPNSSVMVTIVMHPAEVMRGTNSGHIAAFLLGAPIRVWGVTEDDAYLQGLSAVEKNDDTDSDSLYTVSLYPEQNATLLESLVEKLDKESRVHLLLSDGTWGQATSLNRHIPRHIPRVALRVDESYTSLFQSLRKRTRMTGVSTLEATTMAVEKCQRGFNSLEKATSLTTSVLTEAMKEFVDLRCLLKYREVCFSESLEVVSDIVKRRDVIRREASLHRCQELKRRAKSEIESLRLLLPPVANYCYACNKIIWWHRMIEHVMGKRHLEALKSNPRCVPSELQQFTERRGKPMNTETQEQEYTWLFSVDAPGHVRSLLPVVKRASDDLSSMPPVLVADRKTGAVRMFDSKLQKPCSEPLQSPSDVGVSASSMAALQQKPGLNMALSLCLVRDREEDEERLWVGWSTGHISVYRLQQERGAAVAVPAETSSFSANTLRARRSKYSSGIRWTAVDCLYKHRAAVNLLVSGPGPWVFSTGQDLRVLQWHSETQQLLRDITCLCRMQDEYRSSPIRMMCVAMGCSSSKSFTSVRTHFVFFFSTVKRVLYAISPGCPERTWKNLAEEEVPLQRVTSLNPTVTSSALLVGDENSDAAAVLCFGDDEGAIRFTPLTVVHDEASEATPSPCVLTAISDGEYLRRLADAVLTADALHVNMGKVTALSLLSSTVDRATGIMSYCLAAASSRNVITLLGVNVSPMIAGGHISGCSLLSTVSTENPVVSLEPLRPPVLQEAVAVALMAFSDGTAAALFHFRDSLKRCRSGSGKQALVTEEVHPHLVISTEMRHDLWGGSELMKKEKEEEKWLISALDALSKAIAVAEEADEILEKERCKMQELRITNGALMGQIGKLSEALNKKCIEIVALKQQSSSHDPQDEGKTVTGESCLVDVLEQRNRSMAEELRLLQVQNIEGENRIKQLETERDRMQTAMCEAETRYNTSLNVLLREKQFLAGIPGRSEHKVCDACARTDKQLDFPFQGTREGHAQGASGEKKLLRNLLEQALRALDGGAAV